MRVEAEASSLGAAASELNIDDNEAALTEAEDDEP